MTTEACKALKDCETLWQSWQDQHKAAADRPVTASVTVSELPEIEAVNVSGTPPVKLPESCRTDWLMGKAFVYCADLDVHAYIAVVNTLGSVVNTLSTGWQFKLAPGETAPPTRPVGHYMHVNEKVALSMLCYFYLLEEARRNVSERVIYLRARRDVSSRHKREVITCNRHRQEDP